MDRHTPPSPAPTRVDPLPSGFNELLQHNASYSHEAISADPIQAHSQPGSRYGTPGPQAHHPHGIDTSMYQQRGAVGELVYHQQTMYSQDNSSYGPIPEMSGQTTGRIRNRDTNMACPSQPYSTPATSPPTPSRGSDVISTRSSARGDGGARALGPRSTRIEKSTPKKKKDRAKAPKNMPVIDRPMSELTRGSSIAIADIETYVHRSSEVRRQEIETGKNPGRIKRPMNAFMLYRKAYQQRAKEWASQHNHQIVSRVCGMSWPLEPEHIRLQFKAWADTERDNHQKAHPNYKFTPAKPQKPSKYEGGYDERSDGSDLEDYNWVGRGGSRIRSATHTPGADSDYIPSRSVYVATHPHPNQLRGLHPMGMMHQTRSTALDFHSGKPLPGPYEYRDFQAQYFEPHMRNQQRHLHHGADDVAMHSTPSPSSVFQQSHYDLSQQYHPKVEQQQIQHQSQSHQHQQHHQFEHRIDPSLVPQDDGLFDPGSFNTVPSMFDGSLSATQQTWHTSQSAAAGEGESQFSNALMGLDDPLSFEQQAQYMGGEWQVEPLTETAHFDTNWVDPKTEP